MTVNTRSGVVASLHWLVEHPIKHAFNILRLICIFNFGAIIFPFALLIACYTFIVYCIHKYFKPDYETALVGGYKRPIIGLRLCRKCRTLRYWPFSSRMSHYDNVEQLQASAQTGCWLCRSVHEELLQSIADRNNPPDLFWPDDLPLHRLLLWFAERTQTSSGFLDPLRGKSYIAYVYGRHSRKICEDLSSEASFALVKEWVDKCDKDHNCYQGNRIPLPTRVINVGQEEPFLFISNGQCSPYMTLSHCWGGDSGEQPLTTTTLTLEARTRRIPMDSLPPLYRDAVTVTRKLGIHYLWIDSLCIIQDSKEDWAKEAAKMGDIYRLSYLTLYALSSPNCHHGMLVKRPAMTPGTINFHEHQNCGTEKAREDVFRTAELCQRAWALQERLLSPRLLYYSKEEMFWECLVCTAREGSYRVRPYKPTPYRYEDYQCPQVKNRLVRPQEAQPSFPVSLPSDWQIIVSEYTRCRLTFPSDKLPALAGLASIFQRNTGYTYVAGLWKEDMANGLLWYCPVELNQRLMTSDSTGHHQAPSWSWISTNGPVQFKAVGNIRRSRDVNLECIDIDIQTAGPESIDPIISATLKVKSSFYRIFYESQPGSRHCAIFDGDRRKLGKGILDAVDEEPGVLKQCAAVLVKQNTNVIFRTDMRTTYFLIVVAVEDATKEQCWKRLGLAWTARHIPSPPEMSVIQLI